MFHLSIKEIRGAVKVQTVQKIAIRSPAVGWEAGEASRANHYAWVECLDPISSLDRKELNGCQVNRAVQVLIWPRVYAYTKTAYSAAE